LNYLGLLFRLDVLERVRSEERDPPPKIFEFFDLEVAYIMVRCYA